YPSPIDEPPPKDAESLGAGIIVAIVIGALFGVVVVICSIRFCFHKKKSCIAFIISRIIHPEKLGFHEDSASRNHHTSQALDPKGEGCAQCPENTDTKNPLTTFSVGKGYFFKSIGLRLVKFLEGRDIGLFQTALDSSLSEDLRLLTANSEAHLRWEEEKMKHWEAGMTCSSTTSSSEDSWPLVPVKPDFRKPQTRDPGSFEKHQPLLALSLHQRPPPQDSESTSMRENEKEVGLSTELAHHPVNLVNDVAAQCHGDGDVTGGRYGGDQICSRCLLRQVGYKQLPHTSQHLIRVWPRFKGTGRKDKPASLMAKTIREAVNVNSENTRIYQIIHPPSDFYEQKETENSKQTKKQPPKAAIPAMLTSRAASEHNHLPPNSQHAGATTFASWVQHSHNQSVQEFHRDSSMRPESKKVETRTQGDSVSRYQEKEPEPRDRPGLLPARIRSHPRGEGSCAGRPRRSGGDRTTSSAPPERPAGGARCAAAADSGSAVAASRVCELSPPARPRFPRSAPGAAPPSGRGRHRTLTSGKICRSTADWFWKFPEFDHFNTDVPLTCSVGQDQQQARKLGLAEPRTDEQVAGSACKWKGNPNLRFMSLSPGWPGRARGPYSRSKLSKQSAVQPRGGIPRPARAPLRTSILPAPLPKRCTETETLLGQARTRSSRPSARAPGTANPSPWLPLTLVKDWIGEMDTGRQRSQEEQMTAPEPPLQVGRVAHNGLHRRGRRKPGSGAGPEATLGLRRRKPNLPPKETEWVRQEHKQQIRLQKPRKAAFGNLKDKRAPGNMEASAEPQSRNRNTSQTGLVLQLSYLSFQPARRLSLVQTSETKWSWINLRERSPSLPPSKTDDFMNRRLHRSALNGHGVYELFHLVCQPLSPGLLVLLECPNELRKKSKEIEHVLDGQGESAAPVHGAEQGLKQVVHELLQRALVEGWSGVIMGARDRRLSGLPVYLKEESEEKGAAEAYGIENLLFDLRDGVTVQHLHWDLRTVLVVRVDAVQDLQGLVLDLLPDELVLTQGVAGLARDGIDGALLHLLLDGAVQHEERLPRTLLWADAGRRKMATEEGVVVLIDEVGEQLLEDVGGVLQAALQAGHDERGHVATVPHGEAALQLQGADEGQQEHLVVDELGEELQGLLHVLLPVALHLGWAMSTMMTMMSSRLPPAAMLTMAGRVSKLSEMTLTEPGENTMPPTAELMELVGEAVNQPWGWKSCLTSTGELENDGGGAGLSCSLNLHLITQETSCDGIIRPSTDLKGALLSSSNVSTMNAAANLATNAQPLIEQFGGNCATKPSKGRTAPFQKNKIYANIKELTKKTEGGCTGCAFSVPTDGHAHSCTGVRTHFHTLGIYAWTQAIETPVLRVVNDEIAIPHHGEVHGQVAHVHPVVLVLLTGSRTALLGSNLSFYRDEQMSCWGTSQGRGLSNISGRKTNMDQGKEMATPLDGPSEKGGPLRIHWGCCCARLLDLTAKGTQLVGILLLEMAGRVLFTGFHGDPGDLAKREKRAAIQLVHLEPDNTRGDKTLQLNSQMTQQTILSEILVSLNRVSFLTQVAQGSEEFVDSHNGKGLNPSASALLEMQCKGAVRLASSKMDIEGFGKSKADGLKAMEQHTKTPKKEEVAKPGVDDQGITIQRPTEPRGTASLHTFLGTAESQHHVEPQASSSLLQSDNIAKTAARSGPKGVKEKQPRSRDTDSGESLSSVVEGRGKLRHRIAEALLRGCVQTKHIEEGIPRAMLDKLGCYPCTRERQQVLLFNDSVKNVFQEGVPFMEQSWLQVLAPAESQTYPPHPNFLPLQTSHVNRSHSWCLVLFQRVQPNLHLHYQGRFRRVMMKGGGGLQALFDLQVDGPDGEGTEGGVIRRVVILLLPFGEDGEEHVVLAADVEGLGQRVPGLGEVSSLQEAIFHPGPRAAEGQGHVGVELGVVLAEPHDARGVEEVSGRVDGHALGGLRLDGEEVDEAPAGEAVDVEDVKVGDQGQAVPMKSLPSSPSERTITPYIVPVLLTLDRLPVSLYTRLMAPTYTAPVPRCTVKWLKVQSRFSEWKVLNWGMPAAGGASSTQTAESRTTGQPSTSAARGQGLLRSILSQAGTRRQSLSSNISIFHHSVITVTIIITTTCTVITSTTSATQCCYVKLSGYTSPQSEREGRCAVEARRGAPPASSPEGKRGAGGEAWAGGGGRESAGTRARAALRPAKVADPARGLVGRSRAQAFGAGTPRRRARGEPRRGERASEDRAEGAAYPDRRRRSVLPSPIRPLRPPAAEAGALPLLLPAARDHGDDQIYMESRFIKIHTLRLRAIGFGNIRHANKLIEIEETRGEKESREWKGTQSFNGNKTNVDLGSHDLGAIPGESTLKSVEIEPGVKTGLEQMAKVMDSLDVRGKGNCCMPYIFINVWAGENSEGPLGSQGSVELVGGGEEKGKERFKYFYNFQPNGEEIKQHSCKGKLNKAIRLQKLFAGRSILKSSVAEFIWRECYLPTISFLYIIKISQFDNALYPFHIVRILICIRIAMMEAMAQIYWKNFPVKCQGTNQVIYSPHRPTYLPGNTPLANTKDKPLSKMKVHQGFHFSDAKPELGKMILPIRLLFEFVLMTEVKKNHINESTRAVEHDFQCDEGSDEEFQRTDGRLSLHVTDTQSCFSLTHASVLNHTRYSSSVPQPEPGAQPVLTRRKVDGDGGDKSHLMVVVMELVMKVKMKVEVEVMVVVVVVEAEVLEIVLEVEELIEEVEVLVIVEVMVVVEVEVLEMVLAVVELTVVEVVMVVELVLETVVEISIPDASISPLEAELVCFQEFEVCALCGLENGADEAFCGSFFPSIYRINHFSLNSEDKQDTILPCEKSELLMSIMGGPDPSLLHNPVIPTAAKESVITSYVSTGKYFLKRSLQHQSRKALSKSSQKLKDKAASLQIESGVQDPFVVLIRWSQDALSHTLMTVHTQVYVAHLPYIRGHGNLSHSGDSMHIFDELWRLGLHLEIAKVKFEVDMMDAATPGSRKLRQRGLIPDFLNFEKQ
ncbi:hypothetical protein EI555_007718, partial [Monodon monoceros]